jgi:hypothetical protein
VQQVQVKRAGLPRSSFNSTGATLTRHELMAGTAIGTIVPVSKTARAHIQIVFVNTRQEIGKSMGLTASMTGAIPKASKDDFLSPVFVSPEMSHTQRWSSSERILVRNANHAINVYPDTM